MTRIERAAGFAWPALLALVVTWPLRTPGLLFATDHAYGPVTHVGDYLLGLRQGVGSGQFLTALAAVGNHYLGPPLAQWLLLHWLPLALAGWGAFRLAPVGTVGKLFAATLYVLNPFVEARLLAGQVGVLFGHALLPHALLALLRYSEHPSLRALLACTLLVSAMAAYPAGLLVLAVTALLCLASTGEGRARVKAHAKWAVALAGTVLVTNLYWLLPSLLGPGTAGGPVLGEADAFAFAPAQHSQWGAAFPLFALYGFWREGAYVLTRDALPFWWLLGLAQFTLFTLGALLARRPETRRAGMRGLAVATFLALAYMVLHAAAARSDALAAAWDANPLAGPLRDSQKLAGLVALGYATLGAVALEAILPALRRTRAPAVAIALLLAALPGSAMLAGSHGQLAEAEHPASWAEARRALDAEPAVVNVLVLPWHGYMAYPWIPRADVVASPASSYFDAPLFESDRVDHAGIQAQSGDAARAYLGEVAARAGDTRRMGHALAPLGVTHVLLHKAAEWRDVERALAAQEDVERIYDGGEISLWRNLAPVSAAYLLRGEATARDAAAAIDAAGTAPLTSVRVTMAPDGLDGPALAARLAERHEPVGVERRGIVLDLGPASGAVGVAPHPGRATAGAEAAHLGVVPVYDVEGERRIVDARAALVVGLEAVAVGALLVLGRLVARERRRSG